MEWERAKNYILIFFLLLNLGLGLLLYVESRRYTLTGEQEHRIHSVLAQNNISMYIFPPRRFPPMRTLSVTGFYYDTDALLQVLFENPYYVERSQAFGGYVFQNGSSRMIISNGFIFFEDPDGFRRNRVPGINPLAPESTPLTHACASVLTDAFVRSYFPGFVHDRFFFVDDGYGIRIIYHQEYRQQLVHSNFIEFLVTSTGIVQIEMQFGEIQGFVGEQRMIFSPDEALLRFAQRVRHITQEEPISIRRMDLVYFQEYVSDQNSVYNAVPFYRIFTCRGDRPFLVNAFTNMIID